MGIGGQHDLINNTYLNVPRQYPKEHLMALYVNSWVASKIVDLLVDDVFSAGLIRKDELEIDDKLLASEKDLCLWDNFPMRSKQVDYMERHFWFAPSDGNFARELDPETTNEGDISNLVVVDRYSMSINDIIVNPSDKRYGKPNSYVWAVEQSGFTQQGFPAG